MTATLDQPTHASLALLELQLRFPTGSTVHYHDATLRSHHGVSKGRTGVVRECRLNTSGHPFVSVSIPSRRGDGGSVLDTIPENLTLIRTPHPKLKPKGREEEQL